MLCCYQCRLNIGDEHGPEPGGHAFLRENKKISLKLSEFPLNKVKIMIPTKFNKGVKKV